MKRLLFHITAAVLLVWGSAALCSCSGSGGGSREESGLRIVSLAPSATQTLYELDAQEYLIGCTSYCITRPEDSIEVVSDITTPNIERLVSLKPDVVLATAMLGRQHIGSLERFGIKVIILPYPESIQEAFAQYQQIAEIVGKGDEAEMLLDNYRDRIESIRRSAGDKRGEVFIQIGADPLFAAVEGTFLSDCAEVCGLVNILKRESGGMVNKEFVVTANPDWMLLILMDNLQQSAYEGWLEFKNMDAVKNGRILTLDDNSCQPTPASIINSIERLERFIEEH